jgi:two-component system OmpR family response regulator
MNMADVKVLIVEDDPTLLDVIKYNVVKNGYTAITATDGVKALEVARKEKPGLILLDIMLPGIDGLEVCRILRHEMSIPILMLTAKATEIDKVVGLEIGADDYMTKPFSMAELIARVKALLRRTEAVDKDKTENKQKDHPVVIFGEIEIDIDRHTVKRTGKPVELTPKEFDLLVFLILGRGRVVSRDHILNKVWNFDYTGDTRTVDVHINWLRKKLEDNPGQPRFIVTVRGSGYKFQE